MRQTYQRRNRTNRWVIAILVGLVVLVVAGIGLLMAATAPVRQHQQFATQHAAQAGVSQPTAFYWTTLSQTYYTVGGQKGRQAVFAIVPQSGKPVTIVNQHDGLSRNTVLQRIWQTKKPGKVLQVGLCLFNNQPAWQVSYTTKSGRLCYVTMKFQNGQTLQEIMNI